MLRRRPQSLSTACSRLLPASAPTSLRLPAAAEAQRSASNGRLSWGEQAYNILSQYQAILDITTYLSLNKLFGFVFCCGSPYTTAIPCLTVTTSGRGEDHYEVRHGQEYPPH